MIAIWLAAAGCTDAVKVTGEPVSPAAAADAALLFVPGVVPSVRTAAASPDESDSEAAGVTDPPPAVTAQATLVPETALPNASVTRTTNGLTSGAPAGPLWPSPDTSPSAAAAAAPAVALNVIGEPASPGAAAETATVPAVGPRVMVLVAFPDASVTEVVLPRVPPPAVIPHVTVTPTTGLPKESVTQTASGCGNGLPTIPTCASPPHCAIWLAAAAAADAEKVTATPLLAFPNASCADTTRGSVSAWPTVPVWLLPEARMSCVATPAAACAVKVTGEPVSPVTEAVAACGPAAGPSVQVTLACPAASVGVAGAETLPPPAPLAQVTVAALTGLLYGSATRTVSACGSACPTVPA